MKYLPWGLAALLGLALAASLLMPTMANTLGTVDMVRVVDESPRAQELNKMLNDRYNELIRQFNLESGEEEEEPDRAERERQAYAEYLAYRQELELTFQEEVDQAVREVARAKKLKTVLDHDVIRYGGLDLTREVIKHLQGSKG
ncbi:MAG: hypothetical protein GX335_07950 [Firmicutes bacterium]|nr:hypothetical protein [Bacillota bacterium]